MAANATCPLCAAAYEDDDAYRRHLGLAHRLFDDPGTATAVSSRTVRSVFDEHRPFVERARYRPRIDWQPEPDDEPLRADRLEELVVDVRSDHDGTGNGTGNGNGNGNGNGDGVGKRHRVVDVTDAALADEHVTVERSSAEDHDGRGRTRRPRPRAPDGSRQPLVARRSPDATGKPAARRKAAKRAAKPPATRRRKPPSGESGSSSG